MDFFTAVKNMIAEIDKVWQQIQAFIAKWKGNVIAEETTEAE